MKDLSLPFHVARERVFGKVKKMAHESESPVAAFEVLHDRRLHIPLHHHDTARICVILDGGLEEWNDRERCELRTGDVVFWPRGTEHVDLFTPNVNRTLQLELAESEFERLRPYFPNPNTRFRPELFGDIVRRIQREMQRWDETTPLLLHAAAYEIISRAKRLRTGTALPSFPIDSAQRIVQERFAEHLTLGEVAGAVGMRAGRLARELCEQTGLTFRDLVTRVRVENAAVALLSSTKSVGDIAIENGFYDQAHFTRLFKKSTGVTPGAYRRAHGQPA